MDPRACHPLQEVKDWIHIDWHIANLPKDLATSLLERSEIKGFIYRSEDIFVEEDDLWHAGAHELSVVMHEWVRQACLRINAVYLLIPT
jgi:hypothetical protein